jgi:hypothetical protein
MDMGMKSGLDPRVLAQVYAAGNAQNTICDRFNPRRTTAWNEFVPHQTKQLSELLDVLGVVFGTAEEERPSFPTTTSPVSSRLPARRPWTWE